MTLCRCLLLNTLTYCKLSCVLILGQSATAISQFIYPSTPETKYKVRFVHRGATVSNFGGMSVGRSYDAGLWIGGIVKRNTFVSTSTTGINSHSYFASEFTPGEYDELRYLGLLPTFHSVLDPDDTTLANSFEDVTFIFWDTSLHTRFDEIDSNSDRTMHLEIVQRSYA